MSDVPQWFDGCRLNYAENLLRYRDDRVAIYGARKFIHLHRDLMLKKTDTHFTALCLGLSRC